MNQHLQNFAGDKIFTFVNSGNITLSKSRFPKSSINGRWQKQNRQNLKRLLPRGYFFTDTPNNHQNTYINAEKVLPKEVVISPPLFIFVTESSPGLRP